MEEKIEYLAYNPKYRLTEEIKQEILKIVPEDKRGFPFLVTTVVRMNGSIMFEWDQAGSAKVKTDFRYADIRKLTMRIADLEVTPDCKNEPCDINVDDGKPFAPENDFWKKVHEEHMASDGHKVKDAPHKYDLNVTIYANGYLIANHWMVFGSNPETTCQEAIGLAASLIATTSNATDKPTEEELDIIFSEPKEVDNGGK